MPRKRPQALWDDDAWKANLEELKKYKEQNGHCMVPQSFKTGCGKKLGAWVRTQRDLYAKGQKRQTRINELRAKNNKIMPDKRINKLNSIGFVWDEPKMKGKESPSLAVESPQTTGGGVKRNMDANRPTDQFTATGKSVDINGLGNPETSIPAPKKRKVVTPEAEIKRLRDLLDQRDETILLQKKLLQCKDEIIAVLERENETGGKNQNEDDISFARV